MSSIINKKSWSVWFYNNLFIHLLAVRHCNWLITCCCTCVFWVFSFTQNTQFKEGGTPELWEINPLFSISPVWRIRRNVTVVVIVTQVSSEEALRQKTGSCKAFYVTYYSKVVFSFLLTTRSCKLTWNSLKDLITWLIKLRGLYSAWWGEKRGRQHSTHRRTA